MGMPLVLIWGGSNGFLAERTRRSLQRSGLCGQAFSSWHDLTSFIRQKPKGLLLVRAGSWFEGPIPIPPPSATGLGVCAMAGFDESDSACDADRKRRFWRDLVSGGVELNRRIVDKLDLQLPAALYFDSRAVAELLSVGVIFDRGDSLLHRICDSAKRLRTVQWPNVSLRYTSALRVLQIVTSFQRGGAERICLSLAEELNRLGVQARVVATGAPGRSSFPVSTLHLDLAALRDPGDSIFDTLCRVADSFDILHAHLLSGPEMARLGALGIPLVATIHNSRNAWPRGLIESASGAAQLLLACSTAVEGELVESKVVSPVRTVWNGIDCREFAPKGRDVSWRARWRFGSDDAVLLSVANPRPQKRLHLLPGILARVLVRSDRPVRLVFAGEVSPHNPDSVEAERMVRAEVDRLGLEHSVRWASAVADMPSLLSECDVLVAASAYEGLSLAQLEALAMGLPVVCAATAGTRELARQDIAITLLPLDATVDDFALAINQVLNHCRSSAQSAALPGREMVLRNFSSAKMAERCLWFYRRLTPRAAKKASGLWLITNNFSMGGAQSSARRLLLGLAASGVSVRAAVVQEELLHPTPGRAALQAAGISVRAFGPHGTKSAEAIVQELLQEIDAEPPEGVVFWNLIASYKVLLADSLLNTRVFAVSPGEMFYDSWMSYFANPKPGWPYLDPSDYGQRLSGVIVKYSAEAEQARMFGTPVHVIPNGVNPIAFPDGAKLLVLGTAARIHPQKRLEDLIEALRLAAPVLPPFELRVAGRVEPGSESYFAKLESLSGDLPIRWLGELPDCSEFLDGLDLFLMISEPAGCPNALLEALGAGLPVIATNVGGAREQVIDGVNGRLTPPRDAKGFAEALIELAAWPKLRDQFGADAREHIRRHFSLDRMVNRYREVCGLSMVCEVGIGALK